MSDAELLSLVQGLKKDVQEQIRQGVKTFQAQSDSPSVSEVAPQKLEKKVVEKDSTGFEALQKKALACTQCVLSETRTQVVFGAGNENADLMFVGEAPGYDEDVQGLPFVGLAGQLLSKIILAMGLTREEVYIANVLKCRPPNNRSPQPDEIEQCSPYLKSQIDHVKPKVIVALGAFAAQTLLKTDKKISGLRGFFHDFEGIQLMPTYHPAFLLRSPSEKKSVWEDMKIVLKALGKELPNKK